MRPSKSRRQIWAVEEGRGRRRNDLLAVEEPLEIQLRVGGARKTVAITMRTPGHDFELAAGFLYSENIIQAKQDVGQMIYCVDGEGDLQEYNVLAVHLRRPDLPHLPELDRHFFTNSACGVCGRTMLDELAERALPPLGPGPAVSPATLAALPERLRAAQPIFGVTGGLHAAALFSADGALLAVREDVGRHNALDKLLGWALLDRRLPLSDHIIFVSGRASYELLYKCRAAGAPLFCAVSAPSSLAVDLAARFDITLVGFLRGERFNVYTGVERVAQATPAHAAAPAGEP